MPKIECSERTLFGLLGRRLERKELEELLPAAKAELDEWAGGVLKIELNDTNRPDLWSGAGLARQLRVYLGARAPEYPFLSTAGSPRDTGGRTLVVDEGLRKIRPYSVAFLASGLAVSDDLLKELIQSQEKLCWNYGRKRSSIAMGVMRGEKVKFPVRFQAADPDKTSFVPLDFDRPMTLRQILEKHPKGVEFGPIIARFPRFPHLVDAAGADPEHAPGDQQRPPGVRAGRGHEAVRGAERHGSGQPAHRLLHHGLRPGRRRLHDPAGEGDLSLRHPARPGDRHPLPFPEAGEHGAGRRRAPAGSGDQGPGGRGQPCAAWA